MGIYGNILTSRGGRYFAVLIWEFQVALFYIAIIWLIALWTRGSAIAEEPRDTLRQLKYYGRFLTELLTRRSANPEEPCETLSVKIL